MSESKLKFRASYSVLDKWAKGNFKGAVAQYLRMGFSTSQAMAAGKVLHDDWNKYTAENSRLPEVFGNDLLENPVCEQKRVVQLDDWLELVFVPDCVAGGVIREYKTGQGTANSAADAEAYVESMQVPVYAVGLAYDGIYVDRGIYHHYSIPLKKATSAMRWITDDTLVETEKWIRENSRGMFNYLIENKLI